MLLVNLLQNLALLVALSLFHQGILHAWSPNRRHYQAFSGLLFGLVGLVGMMTPVHYAPGVFFDGRSIVLAIAGFFGGAVTTLVAALLLVGMRLALGGAGALTGVLVVLSSSLVGLGLRFLRRRQPQWHPQVWVWGLGIVTHVAMFLLMVFLPSGTRELVWRGWGLVILGIYPPVTVLVANIFLFLEHQRHNALALRESESRYRTLFEEAVNPVFLLNEAGLILEANRAGRSFLRADSAELLGRPLTEWLGMGAVSGDDSYPETTREILCRVRGRERALLLNLVPHETHEGTRIFCIGQDITERRRMELHLADHLVLTRSLLDSIPNPVFHVGVDGSILGVNQSFERFFGRDRNHFMGRKVGAWVGWDQEGTVDGHPGVSMARVERGDGRWAQVQLHRATYADSSGKPAGVVGVLVDLSDLLEVEEALRQSESRGRALLEAMPDLLFRLDGEGRVLDLHAGPLTQPLVPREIALGQRLDQFLPAPIWLETREKIRKVMAGSREEYYEYSLEQGEVPRRFEARMVRLDEHELLAVVRDVTEIREMQAAYLESEARYRDLFETMTDGVAMVEPLVDDGNRVTDYRFLAVNPAFRNMLRIRKAVTGGTARTAFHPHAPVWLEAIGRVLRSGRAESFESYLERLNTHVQVMLSSHHPRQVVLVLQDITLRKMTEQERSLGEERLRRMVYLLQHPVHSLQGFLRDALQQALAMTGSRRGLLGLVVPDTGRISEPILVGWPHEQQGGGLQGETLPGGVWQDLIGQREGMLYNEIPEAVRDRMSWPAPGFFARRFLGVPVIRGGSVVAVAGLGDKDEHYTRTDVLQLSLLMDVAFQIVERKEAEENRKQLQEQLLQSQKMESVGRLAGGVAHDFNNMLGVIIGHSEMVLDHLRGDEDLSGHVRHILKAAERSARLTQQLLAFARKQPVQPRHLNPNELIPQLLGLLERILGETVRVVWEPGEVGRGIWMDEGQLGQVVTNLVVNARDALPKGGHITLRTGRVSVEEWPLPVRGESLAPGPYVILEVEDDGVGMDGETQEHLFEPFFTTKGPGKGTGLGLATIYGILHQNSGAVSVESEPGRGSLFRVYLPESLWEDDGSGKVVNPAVEGGRETVLLVEDEPALLELSWVILRRLGYRVLKADRPEKALAIVRSWTGAIDLLVTDVIMPGQNGRELFQSLLPLKPGLKCLFVSGYSEEVLHGKDVLEPGVHLLAKPFSKADLARAVRSVLGGGKD